ncbi:23S rRNA (guanosine(2251)-2'-O)-methyltransferase RlmB [Salipaludibacillus sp. LMS25]|jgi:23S rRNA (guanosine2251-2'-O)-methyltransferase|uniref:23S rRNA (guanosine(2251)-2'-O)-methyltransferase RlmB n=1 Tax=Salipaludibacillus sp. LMS25 TaxID=2924031 RepID=UPI0020CFF049|nr:23S rRNA (guanosine(2251)-2'-O)-methyltransferase RlmB [Salipaludibacillus sp. LMS25]UTR16697.1 23S rRNA (guanosine(2251)-2'-O)-methyltransferase RlmB [Salipaludibacillus sp. LMS25]
MADKHDLIAGKNPVAEAIKGGHAVNKIWVAEGSQKSQMSEIMQLSKKKGIQVQFVPKKKLDQMAVEATHQGVVAQIAPYEYMDLEKILERARAKNESPFLLLLDELEDPHNLGSILRTADATGAHGVIIPKRRSVGLTSTVAKASAGAIEHVPVARVTNLARTMEELKKDGLWFIGTDAKGDADYREVDVDLPLCLVIGSEGRGISRLVKEKCDFLVSIPLAGKVTSLNASVAASLLMYEVTRRRPMETT